MVCIIPKPETPNPDAMLDADKAAGQEEEEAGAEEEGCPKGAAAVSAVEEA